MEQKNISQQNISIYKDNDDLYIRIKNCPENLNEIIVKMFSVIGETKSIKPVQDIQDAPVKKEDAKENTNEKVFTWGKYKGMKPTEILRKIGKEKAFVFFKSQTTIFDKTLEKNVLDIMETLKKELALKLSLDEEPSYDDMNVFFREYQSLFKEELDTFLKEQKANSIEDVLNNPETYSFYTKMIKKIIN